eukprot:TRINITY_DN9646_c0_g1_i6.p1 TRINITY_DN9646_c0_g1~~TRINITY_DN9646_c0_g1_i6.p1  ORF type:complete len:822 (+),score=149.15 TRINITY_DN9646_c0_g1_i6:57-2468(+)
MAEQLLREVFDTVADQSGRMSLNVVRELCATLEGVGEDEIEASFFQAFDEGGDGALSADDWCSGVMERLHQLTGTDPEELAAQLVQSSAAVQAAMEQAADEHCADVSECAEEAGPDEAGPDEAGPDEAGPDEVELGEAGPDKAVPDEVAPDGTAPADTAPDEAAEATPDEVSPEHLEPGDAEAADRQEGAEHPPCVAVASSPAASVRPPQPATPQRRRRREPTPPASREQGTDHDPVDFRREGRSSSPAYDVDIDLSALTTGERLYYTGCGREREKQEFLRQVRETQILEELSTLSPPQITALGRRATARLHSSGGHMPHTGSEARSDLLVEEAVRAGLWVPAADSRGADAFANVGDVRTSATLMNRRCLAAFLMRQPGAGSSDAAAQIDDALAKGLWREGRRPDGTLRYINVSDSRVQRQSMTATELTEHLDRCRRAVTISEKSRQLVERGTRRYNGPVCQWALHAAKHRSRREGPRPDPVDFTPNINRRAVSFRSGEMGKEVSTRLYHDAVHRAEARKQLQSSGAVRATRDPETGCPLFVPNAKRKATPHVASPQRSQAPSAAREPAGEQVVHRLLSAGQTHTRRMDQMRRTEIQCKKPLFRPELSERTRELAEHRTLEQASRPTLSQIHKTQAPADVLPAHDGAPFSQVGRPASAAAFLSRNERKAKQQRDRIAQLRLQQEERMLEECTFRPKISCNSQAIAERGWAKAEHVDPVLVGEVHVPQSASRVDVHPRSPGLSPPLSPAGRLLSPARSASPGTGVPSPAARSGSEQQQQPTGVRVSEFEREVEAVLDEWRKITM